MKKAWFIGALVLATGGTPAAAQQAEPLGEVVVTANRMNARYAQPDRPVVGLRRQADSAVMLVSFGSDAREETVRRREIHAMLGAAIDRAGASGVSLVTGNFELVPVTRAGFPDLPLQYAGRVDTSKVDVMVKAPLAGSLTEAQARIAAFLKALPRSGRGTIDPLGGLTLTIVNPDQYRETIVKLVAEDAQRSASLFGSGYGVQISGLDGQVGWSQVSGTDVFLYIPYRYTIVPR